MSGATIGLLAGLTGTGGGIFLTPLLVLAGWTGTRDAAGLSGSFILVNSIAGLAGLLSGGLILPSALPLWIGAVAAGGLIGSWLGAARYSVLNLGGRSRSSSSWRLRSSSSSRDSGRRMARMTAIQEPGASRAHRSMAAPRCAWSVPTSRCRSSRAGHAAT